MLLNHVIAYQSHGIQHCRTNGIQQQGLVYAVALCQIPAHRLEGTPQGADINGKISGVSIRTVRKNIRIRAL